MPDDLTRPDAARARDHAELLTVQQYADRYGVHVQSVYAAIRRGQRLHGAVVRPTPRTIRIVLAAGAS